MHFLHTFLVLAMLVFFLSVPHGVYAESWFKVSPAVKRIRPDGQTNLISIPITVENLSSNSLELSLRLTPFKQDKSIGAIRFLDQKDNAYERYEKLISDMIFPKEILLRPHGKKTISIDININPSLHADDYYISAIFETRGLPLEVEKSEGQIQVRTRTKTAIASLILLSFSKSHTEGISLASFKLPFFTLEQPLTPSITIKNDDETYAVVSGSLTVKDLFQREVGFFAIPEINVLSKTTRSLPLVSVSSTLKNYQKSTENNKQYLLSENQFPLGFYTVRLSLLANNQTIFKRTENLMFVDVEKMVFFVFFLFGLLWLIKRVRLRLEGKWR